MSGDGLVATVGEGGRVPPESSGFIAALNGPVMSERVDAVEDEAASCSVAGCSDFSSGREIVDEPKSTVRSSVDRVAASGSGNLISGNWPC